MEVLLEVGGFDMDGSVELTMIHTYIDVQKCDFGGGGVPGEPYYHQLLSWPSETQMYPP